jgi:hypothetical protein
MPGGPELQPRPGGPGGSRTTGSPGPSRPFDPRPGERGLGASGEGPNPVPAGSLARRVWEFRARAHRSKPGGDTLCIGLSRSRGTYPGMSYPPPGSPGSPERASVRPSSKPGASKNGTTPRARSLRPSLRRLSRRNGYRDTGADRRGSYRGDGRMELRRQRVVLSRVFLHQVGSKE